ncbi:MAG: hypothetical protein EBZ53_02055 [Verrucomicrobia bacterium]|nr:hypothetical protein [Verrucomicrobiota bacterium]
MDGIEWIRVMYTYPNSLSDATLRSQISFDGGQTTLTVAAIPDARVATAAGLLCLLIGGVELRRRREPRWR